ncbi:MAG TPA: PEPxxWA-CTERM sorting domain-containing protein, partial [Phenylobacterium sp.]
PGATGSYAAVRGGGTMTLTTPGIMSLSVFMGSPDSYNSIRFNYLDGTSESLNGIQLAAGAFNGDQSIGRYMTYAFDKVVNSVVFGSSGDSFEFDNLAVVAAPPPGPITSPVPEPASWALLMSGFALAGTAIRRRSKAVPAAG